MQSQLEPVHHKPAHLVHKAAVPMIISMTRIWLLLNPTHVTVSKEDTFIDLVSGVGQVVLQMAGSFPLKTCIGIVKEYKTARYAERMDVIFRQYMGWFDKRYCEFKLIKGDFLVDEHREKITSSTLVLVNNFAFGPTVDHQLMERFADLRDGARVVTPKSYCPLNFRITDR
ncbi:hypothetical protein ACLKA6_013880 [Drosophila palustris]